MSSRGPLANDVAIRRDDRQLREGGVATPELGTRHLIHAHDCTSAYSGVPA
jgi:hypothetical protein